MGQKEEGLSKETTAKLIHKQAEQFKEEKKKEVEAKDNPTEMEVELTKEPEPEIKISVEGISTYISSWAISGLTPEVVASIKAAAEVCDFTVQELKDFVKEEIKIRKEKQKEQERLQKENYSEENAKIGGIKDEYLSLIRDKKWNDALKNLQMDAFSREHGGVNEFYRPKGCPYCGHSGYVQSSDQHAHPDPQYGRSTSMA